LQILSLIKPLAALAVEHVRPITRKQKSL
jgi:hypothetical protein